MKTQLRTGSQGPWPMAAALLVAFVLLCSVHDVTGMQRADVSDVKGEAGTKHQDVQASGITSSEYLSLALRKISSHNTSQSISELSFGIYNQEVFHFEVLAGFIDLVTSLKPRSFKAYVRRVSSSNISRDYGFDELVPQYKDNIKTLPCDVEEHDLMIFISPEYNLTAVEKVLQQSGARMAVHLIHNGDSPNIGGLLALHPHTRIITLAPHVLAFIHKRLNKAKPASVTQQTTTAGFSNSSTSANAPSRKLLAESDAAISYDAGAGSAQAGQQHAGWRRTQGDGKAIHIRRKRAGPRTMQQADSDQPLRHSRRRRAIEKGHAMRPIVPTPIEPMNLTEAQWHRLKREADWMLPVMDWKPRQQCSEYTWGDCLDGFSIQGQADQKRRNYTYVFGGLRSSRMKCYASKECRRRLGFIRLRMLGCDPSSSKLRLSFPADISPMIERMASINFQPFYEDIYTTAALIAAPGTAAYFDRKFSSTVISSLVTGVPVILNNSFLRAYTFLSKDDIVHQAPGVSLDAVILQVLLWDESQHALRRNSLRQLRQRLFDEAARKLAKMMVEEGLLPGSQTTAAEQQQQL